MAAIVFQVVTMCFIVIFEPVVAAIVFQVVTMCFIIMKIVTQCMMRASRGSDFVSVGYKCIYNPEPVRLFDFH